MFNLVSSDYGDEDEEQKQVWVECFDDTSGFPYYWNTETNEVKWEKPSDYIIKSTTPPKSKNTKTSTSHRGSSTSSKSRSQSANGNKGKSFIGPTVPQPSPEEIALARIRKFEDDLADGIIKDIGKETPGDWKNNAPSTIHGTKAFRWNRSQLILPTLKAKEKVKESNSIALIAGVYGDDSDQEDEHTSPEVKPAVKKGLQINVKSKPKEPTSKLKPVPSVFQSSYSDSDDEEKEHKEHSKPQTVAPKKSSAESSSSSRRSRHEHRDSKRSKESSSGPTYRKSIDNIAETICDKLEALNVDSIEVSQLKRFAIKMETLFGAWQSGALSSSYMQRILTDMSKQMAELESTELSPPGWKATWDRSQRKYVFENLITGEKQLERPTEEEDDDDEEVVTTEPEPKRMKKSPSPVPPPLPTCVPPPLPPPPAEAPPLPVEAPAPPLPPAPPQITMPRLPSAPPPPEISSQVEDMEIDEEEEHSATPILHQQAASYSSEQPNMTDALDSFYSDLAQIDSNSATPKLEDTPSSTPPLSPPNRQTASPFPEDGGGNSPSEYLEDGKRKKTKISSGLSMKRKGVGDLVAKWQNIQDQVKRTK